MLALLLVGASCGACAAAENVAGLFSIGSSARSLGMGGAFSALADDEGAVLHNPAALGWYDGVGFSSLFVQQFGGVAYGVIGVAIPYLGVEVSFLDSGPITAQGGVFRYASQGVVASLGIPIGPVGIGARVRFARTSSPLSGSGWSADPVILVTTDTIRACAMLEGALSSPIRYDGGGTDLWQRSLRVSVAARLVPVADVEWNAVGEVSGLLTAAPGITVGLETWIGGLGARVGYDGEGPTFGLSVRFRTLQIDWAYATRPDLGDSHRVGLALRF